MGQECPWHRHELERMRPVWDQQVHHYGQNKQCLGPWGSRDEAGEESKPWMPGEVVAFV